VRVSGWPSAWAGLAAIAAQVPVAFLLTRWWFGGTTPQIAWRWFEHVSVAVLVGGTAVFVTTGLLTLYHLGFRRRWISTAATSCCWKHHSRATCFSPKTVTGRSF
jgi:hypothetical protein